MAEGAEGVLRAGVRLAMPKAIRAYAKASEISEQIIELAKKSKEIFMDAFTRIVPFGDFYKKDRAVELIRKQVDDSIMRRKMLQLLTLIPEKKSMYLAQKAMHCRTIEKVMKVFAEINVSPVTISKRHEIKYLKCLYEFLLDDK